MRRQKQQSPVHSAYGLTDSRDPNRYVGFLAPQGVLLLTVRFCQNVDKLLVAL